MNLDCEHGNYLFHSVHWNVNGHFSNVKEMSHS
jgi:hypothetical protein